MQNYSAGSLYSSFTYRGLYGEWSTDLLGRGPGAKIQNDYKEVQNGLREMKKMTLKQLQKTTSTHTNDWRDIKLLQRDTK